MKLKLPIIALLLTLNINGQTNLYMPMEFQNAYKNGTRSYDGTPGENYWQNSSAYTITAEIEPGSWNIKGRETIVYTNNSPDSLKYIVIKTYPNHYKKGGARANQVPVETLTDGMILTDFTIDNVPVSLEEGPNVINYSTFITVRLTNPIPSEGSITLDVKWTTEMPSTYVNRIGAYDQNSAFVGYWYPQIGRYDDIDGYDTMEYLGTQEFNTDFTDFDVNIKVPEGYAIWATGTLQNPEKVLTVREMQQYTKAKTSHSAVIIVPGTASPIKSEGEKTWHFRATNVKDFAFGVSNTFKWTANAVTLGGKEVLSNVVYDIDKNASAEKLLEFQEKSLVYLSTSSPGIPYPYHSFTTFIGVTEFDGMEFPMLANNGIGDSELKNIGVTFHELAHTYFPFYVGINEVKYSWMEEGLASYFTTRFTQNFYKDTARENEEYNRNLNSFNRRSGSMSDAPLITRSFFLPVRRYHSFMSYNKPMWMYFTLENLLGEATFQKCLKGYIDRWAGKHPTPYDFMFTINDISNQNLDWFWNAWVFQYGYADLELTKLDKNNSKINIKNIGGLPLPVILKVSYKDGTEQFIKRTAKIWSQGNSSVAIDVDTIENLKSIQLSTTFYPDSDKSNNDLEIKM